MCPSMRAQAERWMVAGSVAWRHTTLAVASRTSAARCSGATRCRRASRARRSCRVIVRTGSGSVATVPVPRAGQFAPLAGGDPAVAGPAVHGLGAERAVELDGGLVPIEDRPFDPARRLGQERFQERLAVPVTPERRAHVEVLQPDARAGEERRERREPQGHARRRLRRRSRRSGRGRPVRGRRGARRAASRRTTRPRGPAPRTRPAHRMSAAISGRSARVAGRIVMAGHRSGGRGAGCPRAGGPVRPRQPVYTGVAVTATAGAAVGGVVVDVVLGAVVGWSARRWSWWSGSGSGTG